MVRYFVLSLLILCALVLASRVQLHPNSECFYQSNIACGVPMLQKSILSQHSAEAHLGEFPWHVAIYHRDSVKPAYRCGGSLVSDHFVLTAAQCVTTEETMEAEVLDLWLGYHALEAEQNSGCTERVGVQKIHVHPEYVQGIPKHDLALLEMERQVRFTDRVLSVCLDMAERDPPSFYDTKGRIPGWGYTKFYSSSSKLHTTEVPLVNDTECMSTNPILFAYQMYHGMFCGGLVNGSNVCDGDSGGGLVTLRQGRWELIGILSYTGFPKWKGHLCVTNQYSAYMKVRYYKDWITNILRDDQRVTPKASQPPKYIPLLRKSKN